MLARSQEEEEEGLLVALDGCIMGQKERHKERRPMILEAFVEFFSVGGEIERERDCV